jgi:hypothetical protein
MAGDEGSGMAGDGSSGMAGDEGSGMAGDEGSGMARDGGGSGGPLTTSAVQGLMGQVEQQQGDACHTLRASPAVGPLLGGADGSQLGMGQLAGGFGAQLQQGVGDNLDFAEFLQLFQQIMLTSIDGEQMQAETSLGGTGVLGEAAAGLRQEQLSWQALPLLRGMWKLNPGCVNELAQKCKRQMAAVSGKGGDAAAATAAAAVGGAAGSSSSAGHHLLQAGYKQLQ